MTRQQYESLMDLKSLIECHYLINECEMSDDINEELNKVKQILEKNIIKQAQFFQYLDKKK